MNQWQTSSKSVALGIRGQQGMPLGLLGMLLLSRALPATVEPAFVAQSFAFFRLPSWKLWATTHAIKGGYNEL